MRIRTLQRISSPARSLNVMLMLLLCTHVIKGNVDKRNLNCNKMIDVKARQYIDEFSKSHDKRRPINYLQVNYTFSNEEKDCKNIINICLISIYFNEYKTNVGEGSCPHEITSYISEALNDGCNNTFKLPGLQKMNIRYVSNVEENLNNFMVHFNSTIERVEEYLKKCPDNLKKNEAVCTNFIRVTTDGDPHTETYTETYAVTLPASGGEPHTETQAWTLTASDDIKAYKIILIATNTSFSIVIFILLIILVIVSWLLLRARRRHMASEGQQSRCEELGIVIDEWPSTRDQSLQPVDLQQVASKHKRRGHQNHRRWL
uniref:Uncharacterized protein LOC116945547 n=1 Tax=Petromyzon marinus TaxID=7757 RepID=A0AAJ7TFW9_PETMA|nr:uncharacterized protein LOC116945547 [Petromyzon marinus]XP_032815837.1 uncharacterized protein LOC116945547 [Petromyzon marinus]XP_032815838.1 uncharacterized protein LOC116945547 [Petromyzon marinus]